jgi:hypothetical protein
MTNTLGIMAAALGLAWFITGWLLWVSALRLTKQARAHLEESKRLNADSVRLVKQYASNP